MSVVPPLVLPAPDISIPSQPEIKVDDLQPGCPTKICNKCHVSKPLTDYHNTFSNPDQHAYTCKECFRIAHMRKKDTPRDYVPTPAQKQCKQCGEIKDIGMYYKSATGRDGYRVVCKQCAISKH